MPQPFLSWGKKSQAEVSQGDFVSGKWSWRCPASCLNNGSNIYTALSSVKIHLVPDLILATLTGWTLSETFFNLRGNVIMLQFYKGPLKRLPGVLLLFRVTAIFWMSWGKVLKQVKSSCFSVAKCCYHPWQKHSWKISCCFGMIFSVFFSYLTASCTWRIMYLCTYI